MKRLGMIFLVLYMFDFTHGFSPFCGDFWLDFIQIDTSKVQENICEVYADAFVDSTKKEDFLGRENCFYGGGTLGILSQLDTTVAFYINDIKLGPYFYITRNQQACEGESLAWLETVGTPGTHQFSEVLIFELLRFQELGVITNERDSFEIQLKDTLASMIARKDYCPDLESTDGMIGPNCCSLVESPSAIPMRFFVQNTFRVSKISQGKFHIDGVALGSPYKLFDLNGKLLRSGVLRGRTIAAPLSPAVLEIGGKKFLLR